MKRNLVLLISVALSLVACATVKPIYYKDGREAQSISCSNGSWLQCYEAASAKCQKSGYDILERLTGRDYGFWTGGETKEMIFACKPSN